MGTIAYKSKLQLQLEAAQAALANTASAPIAGGAKSTPPVIVSDGTKAPAPKTVQLAYRTPQTAGLPRDGFGPMAGLLTQFGAFAIPSRGQAADVVLLAKDAYQNANLIMPDPVLYDWDGFLTGTPQTKALGEFNRLCTAIHRANGWSPPDNTALLTVAAGVGDQADKIVARNPNGNPGSNIVSGVTFLVENPGDGIFPLLKFKAVVDVWARCACFYALEFDHSDLDKDAIGAGAEGAFSGSTQGFQIGMSFGPIGAIIGSIVDAGVQGALAGTKEADKLHARFKAYANPANWKGSNVPLSVLDRATATIPQYGPALDGKGSLVQWDMSSGQVNGDWGYLGGGIWIVGLQQPASHQATPDDLVQAYRVALVPYPVGITTGAVGAVDAFGGGYQQDPGLTQAEIDAQAKVTTGAGHFDRDGTGPATPPSFGVAPPGAPPDHIGATPDAPAGAEQPAPAPAAPAKSSALGWVALAIALKLLLGGG